VPLHIIVGIPLVGILINIFHFYFNSNVPQAFSIATLAAAEDLSTLTITLIFISQFQSNLTLSVFLLIILFSNKTSLLIVVIHFSAKSTISEILITVNLVLNFALENPFNLGILLNKGVCPHSNQSGVHQPDLQF
jgi:hypothetical protein